MHRRMARWVAVSGSLILTIGGASTAQEVVEPEPEPTHPIASPDHAREHGLESLKSFVENEGGVPLPPNVHTLLRDRDKAIALGKALFWDMQVGSDGVQACASCHFHGGADSRVKNQLHPNITRIEDDHMGRVKGYHDAPGAADDLFEIVTGTPEHRRPELHARARGLPPRDRAEQVGQQRRRHRALRSGQQQRHRLVAGRLPDRIRRRQRNGRRRRHAPLRPDLERRWRRRPTRRAAQHTDRPQRGLQLLQLLGRPGQPRVQRPQPVRPLGAGRISCSSASVGPRPTGSTSASGRAASIWRASHPRPSARPGATSRCRTPAATGSTSARRWSTSSRSRCRWSLPTTRSSGRSRRRADPGSRARTAT